MRGIMLLVIVFNYCCMPVIKDSFNSIKLTSSKDETIYINSINWGVSDDYQRTIITKDKNALKDRDYNIRYIDRLEPFIYSYNNDTLKLYFDEEINYRPEEKFSTIIIECIALDSRKYDKLRIRAFENDGYHCVPNRVKIDYPADMPAPPNKKN